jgi:hypothetical protein
MNKDGAKKRDPVTVERLGAKDSRPPAASLT